MSAPKYLIWSNQHYSWWRADKRGYTQRIEEAGRYERAEAERIVADATLNGRLVYDAIDPQTGRVYRWVDEVLVLAPEFTPLRGGDDA